jgi:hypothetical protein
VTSLYDNPSFPTFFDVDRQEITHMRWDTFKIPPFCPQLRVLQIMVNRDYIYPKPGVYAEYANKLRTIGDAYPSLERIELSDEMNGGVETCSMQQKVEECLGEWLLKPKLLWTRKWQEHLPGWEATTVCTV